MRRVIGIDIHRTFSKVVIWEHGILRREGRVEMNRTALEGFGRKLERTDEVAIKATGDCMQVKAIAHAHAKTDKVDATILASLHAARPG